MLEAAEPSVKTRQTPNGIEPLPYNEGRVWQKPSTSNPPSASMLSRLLEAITSAAPARIVPPLAYVPPACALAPDSVSVPVPSFVNVPGPAIAPLNVVSAADVVIRLPLLSWIPPAPESV